MVTPSPSSVLVAVVSVLALFARRGGSCPAPPPAPVTNECCVKTDCAAYCTDYCAGGIPDDCVTFDRERLLGDDKRRLAVALGKANDEVVAHDAESEAVRELKGIKSPKASKSSKGKSSKGGAPVCEKECTCKNCGHRRYLTADHETARRYLAGLEKKEEIEQLMTNGPNPVDFSGTFQEKADLLSVEECKLLVEHLDAGGFAPPQEDDLDSFSIRDRTMSAQELIDILGKQKATDLLRFLYESVDDKFNAIVRKIWLRRVDNDGTLGNYVDMHTDHNHAKYKQSTMVVALNSENDVEGGELFYLNQDGPVEAKRVQGKAHAHAYDVYHGVAPHRGSRISLLIHLEHEPAPGVENLLNGTDIKLL